MANQEIRSAVADRVAGITLHRPDQLDAWTATKPGVALYLEKRSLAFCGN